MKNLKKMLHFDTGGQVPGQSSSATTPGQSDTGNQAGTDTATDASTPGQSQAYNSATSAGTQTGAQAGQASSQSGQSVAPTYSPVQTGSGFTNIQKLIGANTNNQLGNAVGGGVTNTAQQTSNNINNAQNDFNTQSAAANNNTDANRQYIDNTYSNIQNSAIGANVNPTAGDNPTVSDFSETPSSITDANGNTTTPAQTPANDSGTAPAASTTPAAPYTPSQDDINKFQTYLSGQYNGPTQLNNLTNLQTQSADVNNLQNSLNSQEGRQGLLQRFVGGNSQYTQGQQNLDALLLGQTGGQQLSQARLATQALPDINNIAQADQGVAQTYQNQAQDLANYVNTQGNTTGSNINTYLQNLASTDQGMANQQLLTLQNDVLSGNSTPEEQAQLAQMLGVNGPAYGQKQTMINDIFGSGAAQGTLGTGGALSAAQYNSNNVANANQVAAQNALSSLLGQTANGTNLGGLNIDQSQVGTASSTPIVTDPTQVAQIKAAQTGGANQFAQALSGAGLTQNEYDYLTQNGGNLSQQLLQAQGIISDGMGALSTPVISQAIANASPIVQNVASSLQNYDAQNGTNTFSQLINYLNNGGSYSSPGVGNLGFIGTSYLQDYGDQANAISNLLGTAEQTAANNNRFSNLASLLGPSAAQQGGPGRQIIPR